MKKQTTKQCPRCGNTNLVLIRTQFIKLCAGKGCKDPIPWFLEPGQKSPI